MDLEGNAFISRTPLMGNGCRLFTKPSGVAWGGEKVDTNKKNTLETRILDCVKF